MEQNNLNAIGSNKSNTPMILGIVGFVAMIPGLMCASVCGGAIEVIQQGSGAGSGVGGTIIALTAIPTLAGFIFSFFSKTKASLAGIAMIASAALLLIPIVMSANWFFGLIAIACYLIGGIISLQNK